MLFRSRFGVVAADLQPGRGLLHPLDPAEAARATPLQEAEFARSHAARVITDGRGAHTSVFQQRPQIVQTGAARPFAAVRERVAGGQVQQRFVDFLRIGSHFLGEAVGAAAWYGLPSWMPFAQPMFAEEQPGLKLDFPAKRQSQRQLPDQSWFFEVNGSVTNISQDSRSVPPILVVLRDARGRVVYNAEIQPPKRVLAPGESVSINEALVPVPKSGVKAEFGWKPGS